MIPAKSWSSPEGSWFTELSRTNSRWLFIYGWTDYAAVRQWRRLLIMHYVWRGVKMVYRRYIWQLSASFLQVGHDQCRVSKFKSTRHQHLVLPLDPTFTRFSCYPRFTIEIPRIPGLRTPCLIGEHLLTPCYQQQAKWFSIKFNL